MNEIDIPTKKISIDEVREHLAKLLISPSFDPYSEYILKHAITMLEHFEELLFADAEVANHE